MTRKSLTDKKFAAMRYNKMISNDDLADVIDTEISTNPYTSQANPSDPSIPSRSTIHHPRRQAYPNSSTVSVVKLSQTLKEE